VDQGCKTRLKNRRNYQLAQKKKHLSPSTRRRNAQRMDQWKAKREAVGDNKTCVQTQTDDINPSTDEMNHWERRLMPWIQMNIAMRLRWSHRLRVVFLCVWRGDVGHVALKIMIRVMETFCNMLHRVILYCLRVITS
jgi:hypothetical protein